MVVVSVFALGSQVPSVCDLTKKKLIVKSTFKKEFVLSFYNDIIIKLIIINYLFYREPY